MWHILLFRISFHVLGFTFSAWKWGDWKNWEKYYPTVLFTMVVNLGASLLTYHHALWNYSPDALVKTQTILEFINCFIILPSVTFTYLSKFPANNKFQQLSYIVFWVLIFSGLEYIDHYIIGGIYYTNGWSWSTSTIFDFALFSILRLHYVKPGWAWVITFLLTGFILGMFNFCSAEIK